MTSFEPTPVWLRRFTKLVAASTLLLIFAGAMVKSHDAGLSVPDWPNTYGQFMFTFPVSKWVGGIFYEHSHRLIASTVGFLTVVQAIWLWRREPKRRVRVLGWCAVGAVIAQGVLGGLTVLFFLPPAISVGHAALAEVFFCLNVTIAVMTSKWWSEHRGGFASTAVRALPFVVYAQILAGAVMRHLNAGLAIPDFPLSFGRVVPEFTSAAIAINFAHRAGAVVVATAIIVVAARLFAMRALRTNAVLLVATVIAQICLGALTVWSGKDPLVTSLHVATGAFTLALSLITALAATRAETERAGAFVASEVPA